jgi:hypothetical protein
VRAIMAEGREAALPEAPVRAGSGQFAARLALGLAEIIEMNVRARLSALPLILDPEAR